MEQYKLFTELQELRKEIKELKEGQTESSVIAGMSLFIAIGLALFLFSANILYQTSGITVNTSLAWLMLILGIVLLLGSLYVPVLISFWLKKRKSK